jgi:hypothetical protein
VQSLWAILNSEIRNRLGLNLGSLFEAPPQSSRLAG